MVELDDHRVQSNQAVQELRASLESQLAEQTQQLLKQYQRREFYLASKETEVKEKPSDDSESVGVLSPAHLVMLLQRHEEWLLIGFIDDGIERAGWAKASELEQIELESEEEQE